MGSNIDFSLLKTLNITDVNDVNYEKVYDQLTKDTDNNTIPSIGWIKNDNEMGITDPNTTLDVVGVGKNIDKYQQYYNALTTGKSPATKIQNNGQPLGNREFITLPNMKCFDSKFTLHQKQSIVDGMAYYNGDKTNTGVALSAYQTLQDVKDLGNNASKQQNIQDISCVHVKLIKDGYGNTEKGYISTNEYYVWQKKDPPIVSLEPFCVDQDGQASPQGRSKTAQDTDLGKNDVYGHTSQIFVDKHGTKYDYSYNNTNIYSVPYIMVDPGQNESIIMSEDDDESKNPYYRLVIDDDIITSLFLGTITVLGLYIIYRMFEKDIR